MAAATSVRGYDNATIVIEAFKAHYRDTAQSVTICPHMWPHGCVYVVAGGTDVISRAQRHVVVELFNGSVCVDDRLRDKLGARARPIDPADPERKRGLPISAREPLGTSCGTNFGKFRWGLTFQDIEKRWGSPAALVEQVAELLAKLPLPRSK